MEAIHIQYGNDFLCFIQVMDYHWSWKDLVSVADGAIRQIYSPIWHTITTSLSPSVSLAACTLSPHLIPISPFPFLFLPLTLIYCCVSLLIYCICSSTVLLIHPYPLLMQGEVTHEGINRWNVSSVSPELLYCITPFPAQTNQYFSHSAQTRSLYN